MKLIGSISSPYVRKVRIVMAEKKLDYEFVMEDVWAADSTMSQSNPLGKVPCLVMEGGEAKAFGAGLLSSFGELGSFREKAELRPLDLEEACRRPYDPTRYQAVLYVSPSFPAMMEAVAAWLPTV